MAHFSLVRASLISWSGLSAVTSAEFWKLDEDHFKAINGDDGGVWAPTTPIEIGQAGLIMSGPFVASSTADFTGSHAYFHTDVKFFEDVDTEPGTTFTIRGDAIIGTDPGDDITFNGTGTALQDWDFHTRVDFLADVFVGAAGLFKTLGDTQLGDTSADDLDVYADAVFHNDVDVTGDLDANGNFTANGIAQFNDVAAFNDIANFGDLVTMTDGLLISAGGLEVHGVTTLTATANLNSHVNIGSNSSDNCEVGATMTLHQPLGFTYKGRAPQRGVIGPNGGATYKATDCNTIYVPTLTGSPTYTIDDTDAVDGDFFEITLATVSANTLTIQLQGGFVFGTLKNTTGQSWMKLVRIGGDWKRTMYRTDYS